MQTYTDYTYSNNEDNNNLWSSFIHRSNGSPYNTPLYTPIISVTLQEYAPFQDLIDRRNWCLNNLRLNMKQAEALRQENVNLQMVNSELHKQLSQLQQHSGSGLGSDLKSYGNGINSVVDCFGRMRIGEKGEASEKRVARGVENVDPGKKTDVERVKLPKSISVRSKGYLKKVVAGDGGSGRVRARARGVDRVKVASDTQKVYVRGKKEEEPLELKVYNQGMTKTELCNKWQQTGACPYGDHCQFAHGIEELRPVLRVTPQPTAESSGCHV